MAGQTPPDYDQVAGMCRAACERKLGLFAAFRDLTIDDLTQHVLACVLDALPRFDADKASLSTYVGMVAGRRLIDLWRHRSRLAARDGVYAAYRSTVTLAPVPEGEGSPEDLPLADWLHECYKLAQRTYTQRHYRQGRRTYSIAQVVACGLLAERLSLSSRGVRDLFEQREDLRRAVHFWRVPTHDWFHRAGEVLTEIQENLGRSKTTGE